MHTFCADRVQHYAVRSTADISLTSDSSTVSTDACVKRKTFYYMCEISHSLQLHVRDVQLHVSLHVHVHHHVYVSIADHRSHIGLAHYHDHQSLLVTCTYTATS